MVYLLTDYGFEGPYVGQLWSVLLTRAPSLRIVDLCHHLPRFNPRVCAYLLPAFCHSLPVDSIVVAVVDPGVGSGRKPLWVEADGCHYFGPDNGLLSRIVAGANDVHVRVLSFDPHLVSDSFHGRDIFAPAAAEITQGGQPASEWMETRSIVGYDWSSQCAEVVFIDSFGNAMLGIEADTITQQAVITVAGRTLVYARTFCEAKDETMFWYRNSLGLVELAMPNGSAAQLLNLDIGSQCRVDDD